MVVVSPSIIEFPPFALDLDRNELKRGTDLLRLRPKAFELLRYLAQRPGILVTKNEVLESVWPGRVISESGLTELIRELRKLLEDNAREPRFIQTVHRRGYRFIGCSNAAAMPVDDANRSAGAKNSGRQQPVGREQDLDTLRAWFEKASGGERQVVFVSGEPGIGKTTLVNAFQQRVVQSPKPVSAPAVVAVGQCIEQYGAGEAYLPILDAITRLARQGGRAVVDILRAHAPTWLRQIPSLCDAGELAELEARSANATAERMLREMAEALEALSADAPLLLVLEDLHWSDYSTVDLVSYLAQRSGNARLMIIGTFRPVEVHTLGHPLKSVIDQLKARGQAQEFALNCLDRDTVEIFLAGRFSDWDDPDTLHNLATAVHDRTDGHPLFMVNVANYVEAIDFAGLPESVMASLPDTVRQVIERQVGQLEAGDRRILEAAAVAGAEFAPASVAAALADLAAEEIEDRCMQLSRREQFLTPDGEAEWPDGTFGTRFKFIHALYQNVIYHAVPAGKRARMHARIAECEERAWGPAVEDIANELAAHFDAARVHHKAVDYYRLGGAKAVRTWADREAIDLFQRAFELLRALPASDERDKTELQLLVAIGVPLIHVRGYASDEVGQVYERARQLQGAVGDVEQRFPVLWGLWLFYVVRGEHGTALEIAGQLRALSQDQNKRFPLAHYAWGCSAFWTARPVAACEALEHATAIYEPDKDIKRINDYSQDARSVSLLYRGWALWVRGYSDQAHGCCMEALDWAQRLGHPFTLAFTHSFFAVLESLRRDEDAALARGAKAIDLCREHGFEFFHAWATIVTGRAMAANGDPRRGIETLLSGLQAHESAGGHMAKTLWYSFMAEAYLIASEPNPGLAAVEAGARFAARTGESIMAPELSRLRGELLLQQAPEDAREAAQACFGQALELARVRNDKSWELRAAKSLARLHLRDGERDQARGVLVPVYDWFGEGFTTRDLLDARQLIEQAS